MGNTANLGLPYPENTDHVADMAAAIQALANAIDTKDTGWITVATGITYRVVLGRIVQVRVAVVGSYAAGVANLATGVIPAALRPSGDAVRGVAYLGVTTGLGIVYVDAAGNVGVINATGAARTAVNGSITYLAG